MMDNEARLADDRMGEHFLPRHLFLFNIMYSNGYQNDSSEAVLLDFVRPRGRRFVL